VTVYCKYNNLPLHKVHVDVCLWHYQESDPLCRNCEYYNKLKGYEPVRKNYKDWEREE